MGRASRFWREEGEEGKGLDSWKEKKPIYLSLGLYPIKTTRVNNLKLETKNK